MTLWFNKPDKTGLFAVIAIILVYLTDVYCVNENENEVTIHSLQPCEYTYSNTFCEANMNLPTTKMLCPVTKHPYKTQI